VAADPRPTVTSPDDDPYLWLEDIEGARALRWVDSSNSTTLAAFGGSQFANDRDALIAIFDRSDKIPFVRRRGDYLFNFWKDAKNRRGLWRRTSLVSYRSRDPDWDVLIDLDQLCEREAVDWFWADPVTAPTSCDRAIVHLSRGGGDAVVLREFDLVSKTFVEDGFNVKEAKGFVDWLDVDTLLLSSTIGNGMETKSGYPKSVRRWQRGTTIDEAPVVFEASKSSVLAFAHADRSMPGRVWYTEKTKFFEALYWVGDSAGPEKKLDLPSDVTIEVHRDWMVARRRSSWIIGGKIHPPDTLLAIKLSEFLAGNRDFEVLFTPRERVSLQHFFWAGPRLVVSILDQLRPEVEILTPSSGEWESTKTKRPAKCWSGAHSAVRS